MEERPEMTLEYVCSKQAEWSKDYQEYVKIKKIEYRKKMSLWRDENRESVREHQRFWAQNNRQRIRDKGRDIIRAYQEIRNDERKIKKKEVNNILEEIKRVEQEKIISPHTV